MGYVSQLDLESALLAQTLVMQGALSEDSAASAIRQSSMKRVSLRETLVSLNEQKPKDDGELSGLLLSSGMITQECFDIAHKKSEQSGLLIGRTLLITHTITLTMLDDALTVVVMIRDGLITREQGIKALQLCAKRNVSACEALESMKIKTNSRHLRIGDLLCRANLISGYECLQALERALFKSCSLGAMLVNSGAVSPELIFTALKLQTFVNSGAISADDAARVLWHTKLEEKPMTAVASAMGVFNQSALDTEVLALCIRANVISAAGVRSAMLEMNEFGMSACKAVLATGRLHPQVFAAATDLQLLLNNSEIEEKQAISALHYCNQNGAGAQVALAKLGFIVEAEPAEIRQSSGAWPVVSTSSQPAKFDPSELYTFLFVIPILTALSLIALRCHIEPSTIVSVDLAVISATFIKIGVSLQSKKRNAIVAEQLKLQCAEDTKARLGKRGVLNQYG
jgi:hypothetical protein